MLAMSAMQNRIAKNLGRVERQFEMKEAGLPAQNELGLSPIDRSLLLHSLG